MWYGLTEVADFQLVRYFIVFLAFSSSGAGSNLTVTWRALFTGVLAGSHLTCLKKAKEASLLSPITSHMYDRPVFLETVKLRTKPDHWIPRIQHCHSGFVEIMEKSGKSLKNLKCKFSRS